MTEVVSIRGGNAPRPPESVAEACEQFAAKCAALGPDCVMLALQKGDGTLEIYTYPPARAVKLGMSEQAYDVLHPTPFEECE